MKDKYEKAHQILDEGGVVFMGSTNNRLHFIVKGNAQKHYDVYRESHGKLRYICECRNSQWSQESCKHIIACEIFVVNRGII